MDVRAATGELTDDIGFLMSRASGLLVRASNAALAPTGLRVRAYSALSLACAAPAGITQRDLAEVLGLDPSQVVLLVDELATSGLVERRPSDADRRTKLVVATAAGEQVRARAAALTRAAEVESLAELSSTERLILGDLLGRLVSRNRTA
jgi:DNA-binding MarR family transcriptional regulator